MTKITRGVYINCEAKIKARIDRHAEALNLPRGVYCDQAVQAQMDLEDAFGGPLTSQFRVVLLKNVKAMVAKMNEAFDHEF